MSQVQFPVSNSLQKKGYSNLTTPPKYCPLQCVNAYKCQNCGEANSGDVAFCRHCGSRLIISSNEKNSPAAGIGPPVEPKISLHSANKEAGRQTNNCGACGAQNPPHFRFCLTCGSKLDSNQPSRAGESKNTPNIQTDSLPQQGVTHAPNELPVSPVSPNFESPIQKGESKFCPSCHGLSEASSLFCRHCGTRFEPPKAPVGGPLSRSDMRDFRAPPRIDTVAPKVENSPIARLTLISKDGREAQSYPFFGVTTIGSGRGGPTDITISNDYFIASTHVKIEVRDKKFYLVNLSPVNAVYLRLKKKDPSGVVSAHLEHGARFLIGQSVLRYVVLSENERGPSAPKSENGIYLFGTPSQAKYAKLVLESVEGNDLDIFYIRREETVLGRELGDIVFTDDLFLSRRHAALRVFPDVPTAKLYDLGSSNGSFVQILDETELDHLDEFRVGQQLFRFEIQSLAQRNSVR